jgi:hypothetical protein
MQHGVKTLGLIGMSLFAGLGCGPREPLDGTWIFQLPRDSGALFPHELETNVVEIKTEEERVLMTIAPCTFVGTLESEQRAVFQVTGQPGCQLTQESILFGTKRPDFPNFTRAAVLFKASFTVQYKNATLNYDGVAWPSEPVIFSNVIGHR